VFFQDLEKLALEDRISPANYPNIFDRQILLVHLSQSTNLNTVIASGFECRLIHLV